MQRACGELPGTQCVGLHEAHSWPELAACPVTLTSPPGVGGTKGSPRGTQGHGLGPGLGSGGLKRDVQLVCPWQTGSPPEGAHFCGRGRVASLLDVLPPRGGESSPSQHVACTLARHEGWQPHQVRMLGCLAQLALEQGPFGPLGKCTFHELHLIYLVVRLRSLGKEGRSESIRPSWAHHTWGTVAAMGHL